MLWVYKLNKVFILWSRLNTRTTENEITKVQDFCRSKFSIVLVSNKYIVSCLKIKLQVGETQLTSPPPSGFTEAWIIISFVSQNNTLKVLKRPKGPVFSQGPISSLVLSYPSTSHKSDFCSGKFAFLSPGLQINGHGSPWITALRQERSHSNFIFHYFSGFRFKVSMLLSGRALLKDAQNS